MALQPVIQQPSKSWTRSYPPLIVLAVAVLVAALVLPSALNIPNSNPSTVLEYAPVPPEDDLESPPDGNLSSLGLGSSGTLSLGGQPPPPPPISGRDRGSGSRPQNKRCVGNPPRQTEDPMSPPCVPFFDGDNFGVTAQGVTRDEITVLIYLDVGCPNYECSLGDGTYWDLDRPPRPRCPKTWPGGNDGECDYIWIRIARGLNRYFNARFQTYGRRVHYWAYMTNSGSNANRRADANANWERLHPFAVIDYATYQGFNEAYDDAMAVRGVMVFTSRTALPNRFFGKFAPYSWGFWPDVEHWVDQYANYICQRVAPFPASHAGNPQGVSPLNNRPRVFGFWSTSDDGEPGLQQFARSVKDELRTRCNVTPAAEANFRKSGFLIDRSDDGTDATQAVAKFQAANVTTVLYLGGIEGKFTHAADAAKYYPEIVFAGDLENDNNQVGRGQNQNVWQNAWGTHFQIRIDRAEDSPGYRAYKEAVPDGIKEEARFANEMYRDHFQLFRAIQVAGPNLTPESVDEGFHAIPTHSSTNPYVASCFFDPGDYTCVKDSTEAWWDPRGQAPDESTPGCMRLTKNGQRFLADRWLRGDDVFDNREDPCTGFESRYQIRP